jgi:NAD+ synthase (glutamine-hydrolysing)
MARLRVALCQVDVVVGDLDHNVAKILSAMGTAEREQADLAVFPELAVTGYPPEDLLLKPAFVEENLRALDRLAAASGQCTVVVGYVDEDGDLYNAAAVLGGGKVHGVWHKQLLPNYGVFDERRYFATGEDPREVFEIGGVRTGVTVCEDAWSPAGPVSQLGSGGAELVVVINASPYRRGVIAERRRMLGTRAADASTALVYVNLVGGQDELVFDGGSMVFDHDGLLVASAPQFEECVQIIDLDILPAYRKRLLDPRGHEGSPVLPAVIVSEASPSIAERPTVPLADELSPRLARDLTPPEEVYRALVVGTRDYVEKGGFESVLISLSGGIDSSLVATVAVDALGPARVHGVLLPSRYSSGHSLEDAEALARNLGIEVRTIPIEAAHAALAGMLEPALESSGKGTGVSGLTDENLQSRARGVVVMALSNELGWLVLTTGNKSEMAVGYATLYGDMAGGYAVIRDVPKTLVYELCEWRNSVAGIDLIPENVLAKPPSAELRPDQRDDESLPPYEVLDPILQGYVEHDRTIEELVAEGFEEAVVRRVVDLVDHAEYKRRQAAPGPRVTTRGFGKDRRMPITNGFRHDRTDPSSSDGAAQVPEVTPDLAHSAHPAHPAHGPQGANPTHPTHPASEQQPSPRPTPAS